MRRRGHGAAAPGLALPVALRRALLAVLSLAVVGCGTGQPTSGGAPPTAGGTASPARASATAAPPPAGIDGACKVLTAAQVGTALGVAVKLTGDGPLASTVPQRACTYSATRGNVLVMFVYADAADHRIFNDYFDRGKDSEEYMAVAGVGDQAFVDRPGHVIARKGRVTVEMGLDPIARSMNLDPQTVVTVMRLFLARPPEV